MMGTYPLNPWPLYLIITSILFQNQDTNFSFIELQVVGYTMNIIANSNNDDFATKIAVTIYSSKDSKEVTKNIAYLKPVEISNITIIVNYSQPDGNSNQVIPYYLDKQDTSGYTFTLLNVKTNDRVKEPIKSISPEVSK
jgi:hypothetical protein